MKNENQEKLMEGEELHRKKMRGEIDALIASQTEAELATLRKAESTHQRLCELIAAEKGKVSDLRVAGESTICQLKTAPPDEIMSLSKRKVQLDREIEEVEAGIKNLNNMLPASEEALKKEQEAFRVRVLLITRDQRDLAAGEILDLVHRLESMLAAWRKVAKDVISEYHLFSIKDSYPGGDPQKLEFLSPLLFDACKNGDPGYVHHIASKPFLSMSIEQINSMRKKNTSGFLKP